MQDEQQIVYSILNGNINAFKKLVNQYERLVVAMIRRIVVDEEDIQDISQEVFLKIYQNLSCFKFESKLSTWIARIAYTTALYHVRKGLGKETLVLDTVDFGNEYHTAENPESILLAKNTSDYIHYQVSKLPLPYRTVLTLYHLNELSYQEISEITNMPQGTVKSYLFRARKLLKDKLKHYLK